jgi:hypothetical protein
MRQTNAGTQRFNPMKIRITICILLLLFGSLTTVMAITNPYLTVKVIPEGLYYNDLRKLNASASFALSAKWSNGVGPYRLTFSNGTTTFPVETIAAGLSQTIDYLYAINEIGDTSVPTQFKALLEDQGAPDAKEFDGNRQFEFDFVPPEVVCEITDPDNTYFATETVRIRITVTNNESLSELSVITNNDKVGIEESNSNNVYAYKIDLNEEQFKTGEYTINITAADNTYPKDGANVTQETVNFKVVGNDAPPLSGVNLSAEPTSVNNPSSSVTFTATWSGGASPFTAELKDKNGVSVDTKTANTSPITFDPQPASNLGNAGTSGSANYTVEITSGTDTKSDDVVVAYDFTSDPVVVNLTVLPATDPITDPDTEITLSANWTGGTPPYETQFLKDDTLMPGTQGDVTSNSTSTTILASTLGIGAGEVKFTVEVTPSGSTSPTTADTTINYNFTTDPDPLTNVSLTPSSTGTITDPNQNITLSANWTGGQAPFQVRFIKDGIPIDDEPQTVTSPPVAKSVMANTLGTGSGQADFRVEVTSSGSTTPVSGNSTIFYNFIPLAPDVVPVSGVKLEVTTVPPTGNLSAAAKIKCEMSWEGEGAPFVATLKKNGMFFKSIAGITGSPFPYEFDASELTDGSVTLSAEIVNNVGSFSSGVADRTFTIDKTGPIITPTITNVPTGNMFSNSQQVRILVQTNEVITAPVVKCNNVNAEQEGTASTQGTSFVYLLPLTGFANGNYTINIKATDIAVPDGNSTENNTLSFSVGTSATGNTTIDSPANPTFTNVQTITLQGTCPENTASVEIQDKGAAGPTLAVTGTTWSFAISPGIGSHSFVAISKDANGTEISRSTAVSVTIDTELNANAKPVPDTTNIPAVTDSTSIKVRVAVEGFAEEPLKIQAMVNGVLKGTPKDVTESPVEVDVLLSEGPNEIKFRVTDRAGNEVFSDPFDVEKIGEIDTIPPVSSFDSMADIYVGSTTTWIPLSGQVSDNNSNISYINLVWQSFSGGDVASKSIPFMAASPSPWEYQWNPSSLLPDKYKLWVVAADQATPSANLEDYLTKAYRTVYVDRENPTVTSILYGNNIPIPDSTIDTISFSVSKLIANPTDTGVAGIDEDKSEFTLTDPSGVNIAGSKYFVGNRIEFLFPELTALGTYTVTVKPVDKAGNIGDLATRSFVIDREAPKDVTFYPGDHSIANETHVALTMDQVWATINDAQADHQTSTIEVRYNGNVFGEQVVGASTTALVWDIGGPTQTLPRDQSGDGRYDITVVPRDVLGNIGSAVRSYFNYDCVPPVITAFDPQVNLADSNATWFGLDQNEISITVSDAPKDIIQYKDNMNNGQPAMGFDFSTVQIPGDPNWYNSQGSGINTTNSSFTIDVAGVLSGPANVLGNKFVQARPNVPADPSAGVVDVMVRLNIQDRANDGQVVPNNSMASYTLKFDYLAPGTPSITKPSGSNNKYCKNTLTISGTASDQGSSDEVKVTGIEWSENGSAFQALAVSGLPAKTASFSATMDITDRTDGTYNIDIRAVDQGKNYSNSTQATFVVDRTPPKAPEMVVPLPDVVTNKRGQLFKWATTTDADHYLFQVADDPSFNNILNKQSNPGYTDLVGQVTVMTENSFSVPKDGEYYWRVAAIETCVDGYNISSFSTTRKFTVDTVKPLIVEVQPAPSSGNKITTGMVTFTVRFSELVDTTIPPSVRITSNGGQVMNVEMVSYREDTWIGTTVIPKNNSALYDGNAIISIDGARDIAGNAMAADSTNSVVINTGPAFTTKIFSNPANEFEIMVVTKASEALQSPPTCTIQQNSVRTPVIMNFLKERYYAGSYKIDVESPGKAYIDLSGTDLHGMVGYDSVQFTVAELSASARLNLTSAMGNATLKAAEGSAFVSSPIYVLDREYLDSPFTNEIRGSVMPGSVQSARNGSELVPVMALEEVGPANLRLKKCLLYTAKVKGLKASVPAEKVGLYRLDANGFWVYQGGELKNDEISAQLTGMGRLALMADMTAPSVREQSPQNMDELEDPTPEITGQLVDFGSGIKKDSFKLFIDDVEVPGVSLASDGTFKYKPRLPMKKGRHEIKVVATDLVGNEMRSSFWVTTLGAFSVEEFMPYPNPATGNSMHFSYDFNQTAERVRLKIYDVAGHLVADYDTFDFASANRGRFRWDMRNNNGRTVANGVYFYKLEITKSGKTFKKRGKFAVMR